MYAQARNMNADLERGTVDGKYKFARPNAGGVVETTTAKFRKETCGIWHGFNEASTKVLPDGRSVTTIDYQDVADNRECNCM